MNPSYLARPVSSAKLIARCVALPDLTEAERSVLRTAGDDFEMLCKLSVEQRRQLSEMLRARRAFHPQAKKAGHPPPGGKPQRNDRANILDLLKGGRCTDAENERLSALLFAIEVAARQLTTAEHDFVVKLARNHGVITSAVPAAYVADDSRYSTKPGQVHPACAAQFGAIPKRPDRRSA